MTATRPHASGAPGYSETWPSEPETAGRSRQLVKAALNTWNLNGDVVERAVLVISELVTNSVQHSGSKLLRLSVTRIAPGVVRLSVTDKSRKKPEIQAAGLSDESGRGLHLVDLLADDWGVVERGFGKTVYADLNLEAPG
ncbi:ATP-binding protein [Streptomyces luteolus]|uniref:ATP-binding protein n=1 Tax=Streptomyces luteolus TaxID=3043615 RepID=A0ABT6T4Y7_9ACTN|nr:ATP-binding protein [Streptomyces sp. B-S-A12]MDI3422929.1 ATP-binding protein [Streptomyces sp. B-S-A12]